MYELNNYQLTKLTNKGFIAFKNSYTKGWVVTDGVTMAPVTSAFRRLSTTRTSNVVEEVIRAAVEPFIGKPNNLANRNSITTAIKSALSALVDKLISTYDFKLNTDSADLSLGIIDIDYTIYTLVEIRQVRNRITVKQSS
jgi:phage tail sheath protein FI